MATKQIIINSTITVDYWPKRNNSKFTHSFLTHAHSDHMRGLNSKWNGPTIYCSETTKELLKDLLKMNPKKIHSLMMDQTQRLPINDKESFDVTLIDANHCPGAVMFLFEGDFGTILATGDFRYKPSMFVDTPLKDVLINMCYFDNTYFNPNYSNFPSQEKAFNGIVELIRNKISQNTAFGIKVNKVGKENLLMKLCETFDTTIAVSKTRFNRYTKALKLEKKYFVTDLEPDTIFFVQEDENLFSNELKNRKKIYINPSALNMSTIHLSINQLIKNYMKSNSKQFQIPYSEHSSYNEILEFFKKLNPKQIEPIVNDPNCSNMDRLDPYLFEIENREFSCVECNNWWWAKKEYSTCKFCKHIYEPVPYDEEFGICLFNCMCKHRFVGFGSRKISSKCYKCQKFILPADVTEKKKIVNKTKNQHNCEKCLGNKCPIYGKVLFASSRLD